MAVTRMEWCLAMASGSIRLIENCDKRCLNKLGEQMMER